MCQKSMSAKLSETTKPYSNIKHLSIHERDDIFAAKNSAVQLDVWNKFEQKMILAIVNFLEYIFLIIGLSKCLCTIVKPKIQHGLYSLCILLPLSILLPAFFSKVDAKEVDLDD